MGCTDKIPGLGLDGKQSIGVGDLRFYVSNIRFSDAAGEPVALDLDDSDFQYNSAAGSAALIDLTGNTEGSCAGSAIAFSEEGRPGRTPLSRARRWCPRWPR